MHDNEMGLSTVCRLDPIIFVYMYTAAPKLHLDCGLSKVAGCTTY